MCSKIFIALPQTILTILNLLSIRVQILNKCLNTKVVTTKDYSQITLNNMNTIIIIIIKGQAELGNK